MEPSSNRQTSSSIPRLSRLPLPRVSAPRDLRPSPSRERLQADPGLNISSLRRPSRDHLSISSSNDLSTNVLQPPVHASRITEPTKRHVSSQRLPQLRRVSSRITAMKNVVQEPKSTVPEGEKTMLSQEEEGHPDVMKTPTGRRKPRPSLSERTLETLAQIPSPSPARRKSGFATPQSPMGPPSRPASAMSASRPGSSLRNNSVAGMDPPSRPCSPKKQPPPAPLIPSNDSLKAPSRTVQGVSNPKPLTTRRSNAATAGEEGPIRRQGKALQGSAARPQSRSSSPVKPVESKSVALRPSKPRPSIGAFRRSSDIQAAATQKDGPPATAPAANREKRPKKVPRSSLTLRETIAMAKKAARDSSSGVDNTSMEEDPFNNLINGSNKGLLRKRVDGARTSGNLNIAAMGLRDIPDDVMNMYEFDSDAGGEWYESVDLVKFIVADNELETIREDAFPDAGPEENEETSTRSNQFGGLEILDLHGNILRALPIGLRRLRRLRVLNVSNNKLDLETFATICQIEGLVDLKIANNAIGGVLPEAVGRLSNLEVLDVQGNFFEALPESLAELTRLRILNIAKNKISSIPFDAIAKLPLTEIIASKNILEGTLMPDSIDGFSSLRILDVSNNNLTALSSKGLDLPSLQQLSIDYNRISHLLDISAWGSLVTFAAEDNKFTEIPEGFITLKQNLRNADFTGNDLTKLDERIALMENLNTLRVANNPLRDRKFLTMNTEDLKQELRGRLNPQLRVGEVFQDDSSNEGPLGSAASSSPDAWSVKPGGILDRSSTQTTTLDEPQLEATTSKQEVRSLILHRNLLTQIPPSLSIVATTLITLDLSHNKLEIPSTATAISLPYLKSLNISSNNLASTSLLSALSAPSLTHLDISCNRLTTLPLFRTQFPEVTTLIASDNAIFELDVETIKGLRALNVSRNDIGHLPPKLGLLGDTLRSLEVGGNRFRVPRYMVLEKGTQAVLAWLRDRIPVEDVDVVSEVGSVD